VNARIHVCDDAEGLAAEAADHVAACLRDAVLQRGRATLVLCGGSTPRRLYQRLAGRDDINWSKVVIAWGDERCVPADDPASNYALANETLLAGRKFAHVIRIRGELPPHEAAATYISELQAVFGETAPRFDVVLLGLGADGHTASLFPGEQLDHTTWVAAAHGPSPHRDRVTLTLPALNAAREVLFLVTGAEKASAVARVLKNAEDLPAARVRPESGPIWLLDRAAAGKLEIDGVARR
jgi:6-phosphogluconolactonase